MNTDFTIGADPEMFLTDAAGAFISAVGKIGGSKHLPRPLPIGDGFAVQEDNVAVEYNIPPAENAEELINNINKVKHYLQHMVGKMGLQLSTESAAIFNDEELKTSAAQTFGCDPDYNAWTMRMNPRPHAKEKALRSCGGHVHIGHTFNSNDDLLNFMKHMDLYLGVPSVLMDRGEKRKELYGTAGAFRPKPFGGEYRVLSNFWTFDDKLINWVWQSTKLAMDAWQQGAFKIDDLQLQVTTAINKNDKKQAAHMVDHFKLLVA